RTPAHSGHARAYATGQPGLPSAPHRVPVSQGVSDYPDFGDDVDLLVLTRSTRVDGGIIEGLPASPVPRDWGERIAGAVTYRVTGCPSPLDVQHGRLGIVGEHDAFPQVLIEHARVTVVEGIEFAEPPPEDQLVLQGMQRV